MPRSLNSEGSPNWLPLSHPDGLMCLPPPLALQLGRLLPGGGEGAAPGQAGRHPLRGAPARCRPLIRPVLRFALPGAAAQCRTCSMNLRAAQQRTAAAEDAQLAPVSTPARSPKRTKRTHPNK